jgi:hypothetical protein
MILINYEHSVDILVFNVSNRKQWLCDIIVSLYNMTIITVFERSETS